MLFANHMQRPAIRQIPPLFNGIDCTIDRKQVFLPASPFRLLRQLADAGTSIILYSTDYDELIGCCDRVLILYGGRIVKTLEGDAITETNIVASSFNLPVESEAAAEPVRPQ